MRYVCVLFEFNEEIFFSVSELFYLVPLEISRTFGRFVLVTCPEVVAMAVKSQEEIDAVHLHWECLHSIVGKLLAKRKEFFRCFGPSHSAVFSMIADYFLNERLVSEKIIFPGHVSVINLQLKSTHFHEYIFSLLVCYDKAFAADIGFQLNE